MFIILFTNYIKNETIECKKTFINSFYLMVTY
jgi:hypothetical protein